MNPPQVYMCISHFMFVFLFDNDLLLAVCFIFILDLRNDARQKANSSNFYIQVQNGSVKQQRQLKTSAMHLAQELLTNVQCSGGSRSFAKETRALKIKSAVAGH